MRGNVLSLELRLGLLLIEALGVGLVALEAITSGVGLLIVRLSAKVKIAILLWNLRRLLDLYLSRNWLILWWNDIIELLSGRVESVIDAPLIGYHILVASSSDCLRGLSSTTFSRYRPRLTGFSSSDWNLSQETLLIGLHSSLLEL